jgi:hypothetical protein
MRVRILLTVTALIIAAAFSMGPGRCVGADDDGNNNNNNTVTPDPEAQEAIGALAEALEANRVAAEITNSASEGDEPSLKANGCPNVSRVDSTLTIDYGTGCSPASGFVPYDMAGSVTLDMDVANRSISGSFDGLTYGPYGLDGTISAAFTREAGLGVDFTEQMDLTFTEGTNSQSISQDVLLTVRHLFLEIDGTIDYDNGAGSYVIDATGVRWNYADLNLVCPLPIAGSVAVQVGLVNVTITFDTNSPSTGIAHVESQTMSGDVNVCAYWYGL